MAVSNYITSLNSNAARGVVAADPIYAAIERHRIAWAAYNEAKDCDRDIAWNAHGEAHSALMSTAPTTLTGTIALLDYVAKFDMPFVIFGESDDENECMLEFIERVRDGLKRVIIGWESTDMTTRGFPIGARVEAGNGEDYDTGTVIEAVGEDANHSMATGDAVFVAWDSGVRTWAPISELRIAAD
jgi:hypothetical protein